MNSYKPESWERFDEVIAHALRMAPCVIVGYHGVDVEVAAGDGHKTVSDRYDVALAAKAAAWRASPEGIAEIARRDAEMVEMQRRAAKAINDLRAMDRTDVAAVIRWIIAAQGPSDYIGSMFGREECLRLLRESGYQAKANMGPDFNPGDRHNVAIYLIGQAMAGLVSPGAIHPIVGMWCQDWLDGRNLPTRPTPGEDG